MAVPSFPKGHSYNGMIELNFDQIDKGLAPHLYTEKLHLKSVTESDVSNYQALFGDPNTMAFFATGKTKTLEETAKCVERWVNRWNKGNPYSAFAMFDRESGSFVGHIISGGGRRYRL